MLRVNGWWLSLVAVALAVGVVDETIAQEGKGGDLVLSASSSEAALLKGRAAYPSTPFWWARATVCFTDQEGNEKARCQLDGKGFFSASIPQGTELRSVLLDGEGNPLSKTGFVLEGGTDLSFEPLPGVSPLLWYELPHGASLTFRLTRTTASDAQPQSLVFLLYDSPGEPSSWKESIKSYYRDRPAYLIQPIYDDNESTDLDVQKTTASLCASFSGQLGLDPARCILVAEGHETRNAFSLACNHRDKFGGVVVWEGEPGDPIITNFRKTPVAILGSHTELRRLSEWSESCRSEGCPVMVKSYWSEPSAFDLQSDVFGALDWISSSQNRGKDRRIDHSTYLPVYGRCQWAWITELTKPGNLARVEGEWKEGGVIDLKTTGVSRLRVHLDAGFGRYGQRVLIQLDSLTLPITLGWKSSAVELRRNNEKGIWIPRFLDFEDPIQPVKVAEIPAPGFDKGSELPSFARFARVQLHSDCAWGYKWEESVERGPFSDLDLYERVSPLPYGHVYWTPVEIERFHEWRESREDLSTEISGYRPHWRGADPPPSVQPLKCAIPIPVLKQFLQDTSQSSLGEFSQLSVNQQELVGQYLRKQHR